MVTHLIAHYGEIGLKGNNKPIFESFLRRNILSSLHQLAGVQVEKVNQRFVIRVEDDKDIELASEKLTQVFGIAWFATAHVVPLRYEAIRSAAGELLREISGASVSRFRITAKRVNKAFPMTSDQLARSLGSDITREFRLSVDLENPDVVVYVDILDDRAIVHSHKSRGLGGLPVGVTGRVLHLLSGGIDSTVAAWLMMKRGCRPILLHFFAAPDAYQPLEGKVVRLVKRLSLYGGKMLAVFVPFSPYQVATMELPQRYEPTVFRYFMRVVAERVAARFGALAISTGDNLAQVASQTVENIACIDAGSSLPILRPLLSFDKTEIIDMARSIGTYDLSLERYKDCCSIISRHPKTKLNPDLIGLLAREFDFEALAEKSLSQASLLVYEPETGLSDVRQLEDYRVRRSRQEPVVDRVGAAHSSATTATATDRAPA